MATVQDAAMWCKVYGRKSRAHGDPETLDVLSHQLEPLERLAASHGFTLGPADIIGEIGSGETLAQRPRLKALLEELETAPPGQGRLYVTEISRLSRADIEEIGRILRILRTAGIQVHDRGRLYVLSNPSDEMFFVYEAARNRHEVQTYKVRVKEADDRNLRHGRIRNGHAPFGYLWSKDEETLLPHPHRFPILVAACKEILTDSVERLARRYLINGRALHVALTNPAICGWPARRSGVYPPGHPRAGQRFPLAREEYVWPERENASYPRACTRAEWEAIQRVLLDRRKRNVKTVGTNGWCRDLVRWEGIPRGATLGVSPRRAGQGVPIYLPPRGFSGALAIPRAVVHEQAFAAIRALLSDPQWAEDATSRYWQHVAANAESRPLLEERTAVSRRLSLLRRHYQEAVDAEFDADLLLREALSARRKRLDGELRQAEAQLAALDAEARAADQVGQALAALSAYSAELAAVWPVLADGERRQLANTVLAAVWVKVSHPEGQRYPLREVVRIEPRPWFG